MKNSQVTSKNILHITPHLGGGVGRVLLNYLVKTKNDISFQHKLVCLDYANENALETTRTNNIELFDNAYLEPQRILSEIKKADIVLIHWWNHPLLYDFLIRQTLPPSRAILWSHISGFHPPYIFTEKILSYPDLFVFTTPVSFDTKEVKEFPDRTRLQVVWSTGGVDHVKNIKPKSHKGFNIGYIGTVDYCKMHPDFLKICSKVNIPNVKFIVCGGPNHEELKQEAQDLGISDKFEFTGKVSDITKYLSVFDVFGYPLAPYHYGTCDQVLAESMASSVVPVVLSNKMEKYMVKNEISGLVAQNEDEYVKAIEFLYNNPSYREKLSNNAKKYASETFSLKKMANDWEKLFIEVLNCPKTPKKWKLNSSSQNLSATDVFLESLGGYANDFRFCLNAKTLENINRGIKKIKALAKSPLWRTKTRGTVHHYYEFFKDDENLLYFSNIMSE